MNLGQTQQRIRWITLAILVGSAILLTVLDSTGALSGVMGFVRDPLTYISSWTSARTDSVADIVAGPRNLETALQEIDRLRTENDTLRKENEQLLEDAGEAQILRQMFDRAAETPEYRRITADVIGQDTNPAIQSILINKGYDDGVRVGMPIEAARGLVGQVYRVTNNAAQVALLTETASAIPVRLGSTRATGMLRGAGRGALPTIDWIDLQYDVQVGELVTTSGLGGKFPENLVIGRVVNVERNEAELFQQATVQPAVDFNAIEIVFVVTEFNTDNTEIFSEGP
ncbi:MAG: rod shape-determining protein MreC [Anaerolineae bacterium]|uniref:rod shape-determining protein MreC n=1 Tax=Promineifilum sp. TaxID=2664178 RepID=UPI001DD13314|nr:rod shape-determining protein MreC [Anaerolineales bacterium]MCB8933838.1 rod shape-determining protein MreC [Promineifilum sp.]MCO5181409.1 rod shape-determining protein MreC [Promineifilum sp.]MCW5846311.1 rod shape-determining protein MreC [Anaerolineae bacterium]